MEGFAEVLQDSVRRFPFTPPPILRYPQMAMALNHTGRNISYLCNFPWQFWSLDKDPADGGDWVGEFCHAWRTGGDARPGYGAALGYVDQSEKYASQVPSGPGRWNHLDSLEIGNNQSFVDENGIVQSGPTMTESQAQTIFSLFVIVKSPLFIGASAIKLTGYSLATYLNKEVIAVHQDPLGARGQRLPDSSALRPCGEAWAVQNADGGAAVALVNRDANSACNLTFSLAEVPGLLTETTTAATATTVATERQLKKGAAACFTVRDLWKHADAGKITSSDKTFPITEVAPTGLVMVRLTPCPGGDDSE